jgi:RNA polymerase sigma factor (sigma-70 family)
MASRRQQIPARKKERNAELLDRLLRVERGRLRHQADYHSEHRQDAEDALGDACVQFLLHFDGEDLEEARRWMLVVVKRCGWAIARRRRERGAVIEEVSADLLLSDRGVGLADERRGPEQQATIGEEVAAFAAALATLKADERRALILLALGYSYGEIGELCGWTRSKVNRSLAEGRVRLRGILAGGGENS